VKLTIVGSAGSYPGPDSPASSYLVEHDGARLLLDMGNGSLGSLQRYTDIYAIDAVLISHLHVDHCIDLCSYYVARKYAPDGPAQRIPVFGPKGTADRMAAAYGLPKSPGMHDEFNFVRHETDAISIGPFELTTARMAHPVPTYGMRITAGGRTLVYSADTGPTPALVELSQGADVALYEASFMDRPDNPANLHLTGGQAAEHASAAGVERLVLTHMVAWNDNEAVVADAAAKFDGELFVAKPGLVLEV
jgi:ribonuclease BN (tRNA processing enzyme)